MRWVTHTRARSGASLECLALELGASCPLGRTAVGASRSLGSSLATRIRIDFAGAIAPAIEGSRSVRPMRLMSDSVLHLSDNRSAVPEEVVRADTGLGWRSSMAGWARIASQRRLRSRDRNAIRLIPRIGGLIDSAASSRRSITTASRNAVQRELGSTHGVVVRAELATLRTARLAGLLDGDLGRAGQDDGRRVGVAHTKA